MSNIQTVLFILCLSLFFSCSEDISYSTIDVLPISKIEYTETIDGVTSTEVFEESDQFSFEDTREVTRDSCELYKTGLYMREERGNYQRVIALVFFSQIDKTKLQDNQILFNDAIEFENTLNQQPFELYNILNPCNLDNEETGIFIGHIETQLPILISSTIESGEVSKYELQRIVYNDLGYLLLDAEFQYIAEKRSNTAPGDIVIESIPVSIKVQHAIRFPELDK